MEKMMKLLVNLIHMALLSALVTVLLSPSSTMGSSYTLLQAPADRICGLAFSPDGRTLAVVGEDHGLTLWESCTGRQRASLPPDKAGYCCHLAFSPSGKRLCASIRPFSVSGKAFAQIWHLPTGTCVCRLQRDDEIWAGYSCDDKALAISSDGYANIELMDPGTFESLVRLHGRNRDPDFWKRDAEVFGPLAFSGGGSKLAVTFATYTTSKVMLWDIEKRKARTVFHDRADRLICCLAFSRDAGMLTIGNVFGGVKSCDLSRLQVSTVVPEQSAQPSAVMSLSGDGRLAAIGDEDGTIALWDTRRRKKVRVFKEGLGRPHQVALAPDGRRLAAAFEKQAGAKSEVRLWKLGLPEAGAPEQKMAGGVTARTGNRLRVKGDGPNKAGKAKSRRLVRLWTALAPKQA